VEGQGGGRWFRLWSVFHVLCIPKGVGAARQGVRCVRASDV
jgi:hypothetical protein